MRKGIMVTIGLTVIIIALVFILMFVPVGKASFCCRDLLLMP